MPQVIGMDGIKSRCGSLGTRYCVAHFCYTFLLLAVTQDSFHFSAEAQLSDKCFNHHLDLLLTDWTGLSTPLQCFGTEKAHN